MSPNDLSDDFLEKLCKRDQASFRQLVDSQKHRVLNICYRFLHNKDDAEDLAQEVFVEVYRSISEFRKDADLATWIYRIAVTKSLDYIRRQNRQKRGGLIKGLLRLEDGEIELEAPSTTRPDKALMERERREILRQALNKIPQKQRAAFILSKYKGMTNKELADTLKISIKAAEALIHRAKKNLQPLLFKYFNKNG